MVPSSSLLPSSPPSPSATQVQPAQLATAATPDQPTLKGELNANFAGPTSIASTTHADAAVTQGTTPTKATRGSLYHHHHHIVTTIAGKVLPTNSGSSDSSGAGKLSLSLGATGNRRGSIASTTSKSSSSVEDLLLVVKSQGNKGKKQKRRMSNSEGSPTKGVPSTTERGGGGGGETVTGLLPAWTPASEVAWASSPPSSAVSPPNEKEMDEDGKKLLKRLEQKRKEIDEEIEAFKASKDEEYATYERRLRKRMQQKKEREQQEVAFASRSGYGAGSDSADDGAESHDDGDQGSHERRGRDRGRHGIFKGDHSHAYAEQEEDEDSLPFAITSPTALMALHEQEKLKESGSNTIDESLSVTATNTLASPPASPPPTESQPSDVKCPPFEEEIQLAGLFTPRYLPLLMDDSFPRSSKQASPPPRPSTPIRYRSPSDRNHSRSVSPPPLPSSLKNSASSGFSSSSSGRNLKLKSPKKVSFKLDESTPVPSRSTPPQTILTFGKIDQSSHEEDPDTIEIEQVETLDDIPLSPGSSAPIQVAPPEMPKSVVVDRMGATPPVSNSVLGQSLVMPTRIGEGVVEVAGGGQFREGAIPSGSPNGTGSQDHDDWEAVDPEGHDGDDDDEEDLFDMDETIPLSPEDKEDGEPSGVLAVGNGFGPGSPEFDSDGLWAGASAPTDIIATPHGLREAGSLPKYSPMASFQASSDVLQTGRRGSVPFSFAGLGRTGGVAVSLPAPSGFLGGSNSRRRMKGNFKRRSVKKYFVEEPDAPPRRRRSIADEKGKAVEGGVTLAFQDLSDEEEEEEEVVIPESTFGSSLPITIQRPENRKTRTKGNATTTKERNLDEEAENSGTSPSRVEEEEADEDCDQQNSPRDSMMSFDQQSSSPPSGRGSPIFQTDEDHEELSTTPVAKYKLSIHVQSPSDTQPSLKNDGPSSAPMSPTPTLFRRVSYASCGGGSDDGSPSPGNATPKGLSPGVRFHQPFPAADVVGAEGPGGSHPQSPASPRILTFVQTSSNRSHTPHTPHGHDHGQNHSHNHNHYHGHKALLNPFISPSPYATPIAARVAAEAEEAGDDDTIGSVVGGVDGSTGLDPEIIRSNGYGNHVFVGPGRRGSLAMLQAAASAGLKDGGGLGRQRAATTAVGGGSVGKAGMTITAVTGGRLGEDLIVAPEKMSFSMRLALEEHMERARTLGGGASVGRSGGVGMAGLKGRG